MPSLRGSARALAEHAAEVLNARQVRLVPPETLHTTLAFFGECDEAQTRHLVTALGTVRWRPVRVSAAGWAQTGKSALAVRLLADGDDLFFMAEVLRAAFHLNNVPSLHVTLARLRKPREVTIPATFPKIEFDLGSLVLFQSFLSPGGARYEMVARGGPPER
ncbi:MAG: hypothetical protein KIT11_00135 [Fimbriimonadaceae bacterium]|nr:hypothetical protein [Fimbriimonadaceae bacterium]QYK57163.1 MAG: hypothetical protein KF733_09400 [Fimbriimonadaceae bacterium]